MGTDVVTREDLLQRLNQEQKEAVSLSWGPSLIVAGAGSGKTTVLTRRVAYLIQELKQDPASILAVTFTNKAAGEMKHRLESLIGAQTARHAWIGTFHSICARLLRREIEQYKTTEGHTWKGNFVIYDETDTQSLVKSIISKLNLDEKVFAPRVLRHTISSLKNDGYTCAAYCQDARTRNETVTAEIFTAYQAELARNNALDFDDLILIFSDLLKQNPEVRQRYQNQFRHVLVDEFQDTNQSQYELIRYISGQPTDWTGRTLLVVGDVDQSIYSWRQADYRIILGFQKDYQDCRLIKLEENYRSTNSILEVANSIISNNTERIDKVLRCNRGQGSKIQVYEAVDEIDEAYFVVQELKKLRARGKTMAECVLLYRTNSQSRAIEEVLVRNHFPYTMVGGTRFYDRLEIKDLLAYLKLIYNNADGQSFMRVVNQPRRGLGKTTLDKLAEFAVQANLSYLQAAANASQIPDLSAKTSKALQDFATQVRHWSTHAGAIPVSELIDKVLKETRYVEKLEEELTSDPLAGGRIDNLKELIVVAREFESVADQPDLESFLTRVSLVSDLDAANLEEDAVKLMTLHSAKGLEFPTVFLMGLEDGLLPHVRSLDTPAALEEERRLMYVGVTRAGDLLYLTLARKRQQFGGASGGNYTRPSRFLKEISPDLMQGYYPAPAADTAKSQAGAKSESNWPPKPIDSRPPVNKPRAMRIAPSQPTEAYQSAQAEAVHFEKLQTGDKVQHLKFGIGTVTQVIGEKDKELYNIDFGSEGKRLLDPRFAKLVKLN